MNKLTIEINSYKIIGPELIIEGDLLMKSNFFNHSKSKGIYDLFFDKELSANSDDQHLFKVENLKKVVIDGKEFKYHLKIGSKVWSNLKAEIVLINPSMSYEQLESGSLLELVFEE